MQKAEIDVRFEQLLPITAALWDLLPHTLMPNLLQVVLLESFGATEKCLPGVAFFACFVFQGHKLDSAYVVGNLGQSIAPGRGVSVNRCSCGKCPVNCRMNCVGYQALAVVVVDLDIVKLLKIVQMLFEKRINIFFKRGGKLAGLVETLVLLVPKRSVSEGRC